MNKILIILFSVILSLIIGCSNNGGSANYTLEQGVHFEDTNPGSFLKLLHINYGSGNSFFVELRKSLRKNAVLEDEYYMDGEKHYVYRWRVPGYNFDSPIIILERRNTDFVDFEYLLGAGGISYNELIGDNAKKISLIREIEHSVTIRCPADNIRAFLFGYGNYCSKIVIMEGV